MAETQGRAAVLFGGGVTPCFDQFFSKAPASQTLLSPKSEKKWGNIPPLGHPPWGGEPHFFPGFGDYMV